ncbi:TfoX/Sxy family protein [Fictibacillus nanhaiensis]|uniref:TfoX/Sxy family protein n=1 Tax=Fictibacillus nanhaiensis TaxID=742169 RepID=UPI001C989321|nr:TfoX/Sxy family protein [Fictibacillus nanhaiensis]MBY6036613.1 TfoX/Sxy family protein [Fictibacillus nanhaiensis]
MTALEKYNQIAEHLKVTKHAAKGSMFGAKCIKVNRKVFAMFFQDEMVFKLPPERHNHVLSLEGTHLFEPMPGRQMKEWVSVPDQDLWENLALESLKYLAK